MQLGYLITFIGTALAVVVSVDVFKENIIGLRMKRQWNSKNDRRYATVPLKLTNENYLVGLIKVGTATGLSGSGDDDGEQSFRVVFDTGSLKTWIHGGGNYRNRKDKSKSRYFAEQTKKTIYSFRNSYCGGEYEVYGYMYCDKFCVDKYCVANGYIGVSEVIMYYVHVNIDGIFGMAFYKDPNRKYLSDDEKVRYNKYSILEKIFQENGLNEMFGLHLNRYGGSLTIGDVDEKHKATRFEWLPIVSSGIHEYKWLIDIKQIVIKSQARQLPAVLVDSGADHFAGPMSIVQKIWTDLGFEQTDNGLFDCIYMISLPEITVELTDSFRVVLSPDDYVIKDPYTGCDEPDEAKIKFPGGICGLGFRHVDALDYFIFGHTFLRKVYTVFDVTNSRVGFAMETNGNDRFH